MEQLREDISIGPVTDHLRRNMVEEGWLDDRESSRLSGWGSGPDGPANAKQWFFEVLDGKIGSVALTGIYRAGEPMGYFAIEHRGPRRKTAQIHIFLASKARKFNIARTALIRLLDLLYHSDIYRVEAEVLSYNKSVINSLVRFGFKREGYQRSALWVDGNPMALVMMRYLKKDFNRKYRGII